MLKIEYLYLLFIICINYSCKSVNKEVIILNEDISANELFRTISCNSTNYTVNSDLLKISNFSNDVIYNLAWMEQKGIKKTSGIFLKEFMECLVAESNLGTEWATDELRTYLKQIAILIPNFDNSDFLELDVFINDIINKIDNNNLLMSLIPFTNISVNPDILFPQSHGSISKYGISALDGIIQKQSKEIKRKYITIKKNNSNKTYQKLLEKLQHQFKIDLEANLIKLNVIN